MQGTCDICGAVCEVYPCPACDEDDPYEDCTCFDPDLCADCWRARIPPPRPNLDPDE